jgi:hypothetical protein
VVLDAAIAAEAATVVEQHELVDYGAHACLPLGLSLTRTPAISRWISRASRCPGWFTREQI